MSEAVTSSTEQKTTEAENMEAIDMLAQGKRNMLCGEVPQAVNQLQQACRLLAKQYGETAVECGEAYFSYGKALLDMARMESGVLGNALQGMSEDEEEEDSKSESKSESSEDKVDEDKLTDTEESASAVESEDIADDEGEKEEEEGDAEEEEGESQEEGEVEEGETSQDEADKKAEEEDVSNLQLAWEMLELSKIIYKRHDKKEDKIKLAETHLRLGEVGLETEQYDQAIADFKECLRIQKSILDAEDRSIAETCYQLGLAFTYKTEYDHAVQSYKDATAVIEAKIASLKKVIDDSTETKEPASADNPAVKAKKEIQELSEILPDIVGKIEDVLDEQRSADKVKQLVKESVSTDMAAATAATATSTTTTGFGDAGKTADTKPASDITHLVRKKRKTDEDDQDESKKIKTNGHENGDAEKMTVVEEKATAAPATT